MSEFTGGCHCGVVRFTFTAEPPVVVTDCNCSICAMTGYEHVFVEEADLRFTAGREHLLSYRFGTGEAEHLFCKTCGIKPLYRPRSHPKAWSVNARCVPELQVEERIAFDGQNWAAAIEGLYRDLNAPD